MAVDESHRHELHQSLEATLGTRPAATLMSHLPPVGWADVATKSDLQQLELRVDAKFEIVDRRFDGLERRMDRVEDRLERLETTVATLAVDFRKEMTRHTLALFFSLGTMMIGGFAAVG